MSLRLGNIPAKSTSLPNSKSKIVDKLLSEEGERPAEDALARNGIAGTSCFGTAIDIVTTDSACEVAESSAHTQWWNDPLRDRPLGYSWRMVSTGPAALLEIPTMPTKVGQQVIEAIVADAIVSAKRYPGRRISYSRRAQFWANRARYAGRGFNRDNVTFAVDLLVTKGILIDHDRRPPGKRGTQSSYLPNPVLADLGMPMQNREKAELLILKDADGNMIGYKDTSETRNQRYILTKVNRVLSTASFMIDREEVTGESQRLLINDYLGFPASAAMHRIYNGGWTLGGRFYGAFWMNMKSCDRRHILIDGCRTVEVDYNQLHARMIYAEANKKLVGDAYDVKDFERKVAKRAFFIILNANNYLSAKGAVSEMLDEKGLDPKLSANLIDAMKERHREVQEFFHSGCGLRLQNLDSKMAEHVLRAMTVRKGVPCLPIHDSFIVPEGHVNDLMNSMAKAYEKFVGKAAAPVCSIKYPANEYLMKSDIYTPTVHTCECPTSDTSLNNAYRTIGSEESVSKSLRLGRVKTNIQVVSGTDSQGDNEQLQADQSPSIKRVPMPSFLRVAIEDGRKGRQEEQVRMQAKREARLQRRQMGYAKVNAKLSAPIV